MASKLGENKQKIENVYNMMTYSTFNHNFTAKVDNTGLRGVDLNIME